VPPRERQWLPWVEGLVVVALVAGHERVPLSATPFFLLLGWASLRLRGLRWRDVGLARKHSWPVTLALGTLAGVAMELFSTFVTVPFFSRLANKPPELEELRPLVGNLPFVLVAIAVSWLLAAFGEEMVFRGYLMNRVAGFLHGMRGAWAISLLVVSAIFGACHEAQGLTGIVQEGFAGFLLGLLYLGCSRTLAVPIVAHGMSNTVALVLVYFDRYPGV
jgi:membrane protease YdiL (CAAX protease family)